VLRDQLQSWVQPLRQASVQPPVVRRVPLVCNGLGIGDVSAGVLESLSLQALPHIQALELRASEDAGQAWHLRAADATAALNAIAEQLRSQGRCGPWRNEQLDVRVEPAAQPCATVERGAVRPLGIATQAVHLIGIHPDGRMWVQQRALDKATHPGKWDTLMGGMVSSGDSVGDALARETQEEAGLEMAQLQNCHLAGYVDFACPSDEGGAGVGYMRERIHCFTATIPAGIAPHNLDGEVVQFQCLEPEVWQQWLLEQRFTPEASLVLANYLQL
jgi:8-oxo-dGTP pyrophosphatase MutT (NUDIX family)